MSDLVYYPDERLRRPGDAITEFNETLRTLVVEMHRLMVAHDGIGLAAPQLGQSLRVIIIRDDSSSDGYRAFVNPAITFSSKRKTATEEGCLSIPGVFGFVERSAKIHIQYQDLTGAKQIEKARGMEAIVLQHEIDHLDGILILDRNIQLTKGSHLLDRTADEQSGQG